eukprot:4285406-Pleurochrysis_carterae.AAC.1
MSEAEVSDFKAATSGMAQSGAWRLSRKIGDANAPRSAGCSKIYSVPAACAARNKFVVRRTISLAWSSSRR